MNKLTIILFSALLFAFVGCKKNCPNGDMPDKPVFTLSKEPLMADNSTETTIKISIPYYATADRRKLIFSVDSGTLKGAKDGKLEVSLVKDLSNPCLLSGTAIYISSAIPGYVRFTYWLGNSQFLDSILVEASKPTRLKLTPSSYAVKANFGSEITITGKVTNDLGLNASKGYRVVFTDYFTNHSSVQGHMRQVKDTVDINGNVSLSYTPGFVHTPDSFYLKGVMYMPDGVTPITPEASDSLKLYIN